MDFHSLTRKELQTLCKKNKIPANMTNVAMADALASLQQVEGLGEFLNPMESDAQQCQEEKVVGTPDIHRTACRTSTRRKAIKEEATSSKVSTRLRHETRAGNADGDEQENKHDNVPVTPAMPPSSRRRGPAVSALRKKEAQMVADEKDGGFQGKPTDVPKTPAVPSSRTRATSSKIDTPNGTSIQRAYSTRRSVRLLEKNLAKMSFVDTEDLGLVKVDDASEEMSNVSQQTEDSAESEKGASLQTVSATFSEKTDELEISSGEKDIDYEGQSLKPYSQVQIGSGTENDVESGLQAEPQQGSGKINDLEAEPHNSNIKLEGSAETYDGSIFDEPVVDLNKSVGKTEVAGNDGSGKINDLEAEPHNSNIKLEGSAETNDGSIFDEPVVDLNKSVGKTEVAGNEAGSGLLFELEDSCDSSEPENKKGQVTNQDALTVEESEEAFLKVTGQDVATTLSVEPQEDSAAVTYSGSICDESVVELNKSIGKTEDADNEAGSGPLFELEDSCVSSEIKDKKCQAAKQDDALSLEVAEDAVTEVTGQDVATLSVEVPDDASMKVTDQDVAGSLHMPSVNDDSKSLKELAECYTNNNEEKNNEGDQGSNDGDDNQVENNETEHWNVADGNDIQNVDETAADEENLACPEVILVLTSSKFSSSGEEEQECDAKEDHWEESSADIVKMVNASDVPGASSVILAVEKEASSENFTAVIEVCIESSANKNMDVENGSLLEADEQKDNSLELEVKAIPEESEEHKAAEETQQVSVDSAALFNYGLSIDSGSSDAFMSALGCNANTLVEGDVIAEEIAIPKQESLISAETMLYKSASIEFSVDNVDDVKLPTMTTAPICEQNTSDIPIQTIVIDQMKGVSHSEPKDVANEDQTVQNDGHTISMMKENLSKEELEKESIRKLKKMLKDLTLNEKSNKTNIVAKEVEKKRIALKALPDNRMTTGEAQNDG